MRPALLTILVICWMQNGVHLEECGNPEVSRQRMLIYRIIEEVEVDVLHCKFSDKKNIALTYFDITKNCLRSPTTGIFVDKWEERNPVNEFLDMKRYKAKADLIRNEIKLRSGTICRYDRGFCYDDRENENYAAVWELKSREHKPVESCPEKLEQLFYGPVDIWDFPDKGLKYLFYYDYRNGDAFYLRLFKKIDCRNFETWVTEGDSFVVSSLRLTPQLNDTSILNKHYLPLKSSKRVSEAIMENCELQGPLDFSSEIGNVYFEEPENARILFQKLREEMESKLSKLASDQRNSVNTKTRLNEIGILNHRIAAKAEEIVKIWEKLERTAADQRVIGDDVSYLQEIVSSFSENYNKDVKDFNSTLAVINLNIQRESGRISSLIFKKDEEYKRNFKYLTSLVRNEVVNLTTKLELEDSLSFLKEKLNTKVRELEIQLDLLIDMNKQFEQSLDTLRSEDTELREDFKNSKGEFDSKLEILGKRITKSSELVAINFTRDLEQISERKCSSEADAKIANLRKYIDDFKISSTRASEISIKNVNEAFDRTTRFESETKNEISDLKAGFDYLNRNIARVQWDLLENIKDEPISSSSFHGELSAMKKGVNENIELLKQEFAKKLKQQESRCSCNDEIEEMKENLENSLAALQRDVLEKTKFAVETTKSEMVSELNEAIKILRAHIEFNKEQLDETISRKLLEKDQQIDQLERTFAIEVAKLRQTSDGLSKKVADLESEAARPQPQ